MSDAQRRRLQRNKANGRNAETFVVDFLIGDDGEYFPNAERRRLAGVNDKGDISGVPAWTLEVKSGALHIREWLREAAREAENAGTINHAVIWKPPGLGASSASEFVFMVPLWLGRRVMKEYQ